SSVEVDASVAGSVVNHGSDAATYEATVSNASISVTGTGFTSPLTATQASLLDTGAINCPAFSTTTIGPFAASLASSSDVTLSNPADLAAFIGNGNLSYTTSASAESNNTVSGGTNISNNTTVFMTGTATVEVIYVFVNNPSFVTAASSAVALGTAAPTLTDSAALSGGSSPTGAITFVLTGPDGFSYTQPDTVNGNGSYTAGDTPPASGMVVGTYTWSAHYSGDAVNSSSSDQGGTAEQTVVSTANPNVVTTASPGSVTLGTSGSTLNDSAV